jgi:putative DNA primase/helicase
VRGVKEEEFEKKLVAALLRGDPMISVDNVRVLMEGDLLCTMAEQELLDLRPLGKSKITTVKNMFCLYVNGNNIEIAADMVRRFIRARLDPNVENPETRVFTSDPRREILAARGHYIAAALTIVRYYVAAGMPGRLRPLMSYEQWSDLVRSSLVHLGLPDPVETQDALRTEDPVRRKRGEVFSAWRGLTTLDLREAMTTAQLVAAAKGNSTLFEALHEVAPDRHKTDELDADRLGRWLKNNKDGVAGGFKLKVEIVGGQKPRWRLVPQ